ncbi:AzlD domain-containing protein [Dictyobacter aurantiacus]|uniref:Branched-chain amino acid ABC transporter n=1 Tax=Dictyobacter aurantiacus TaxID=1936993 RepID=A0A401ZP76_9CHLR|nr:AzlD domain-containing protein [Dictyobacter aurantiacus]GCE08677.1 branched-chain amino acid ABC transporter [Dictyobacter aurantiacus]
MSQQWLWITIITIGLLTLGTRLSFIVFMGKMQVAPIVQQALRFVPIAVLSALIAPALFFPGGSLDISLSNARLIAGILAILIAWRTKNVLLTIASGMACLLILQTLVSHH